MIKTDLIIIGAGPGGYHTAYHATKEGLTVAIFEDREVGGTCLNSGCIPTKTYCHFAEVVDSSRECAEFGLDNLKFNINFSKIHNRKNEVVSQLRSGIDMLMQAPGITFVKGKASFKDTQTIICNNEEYQAKHIIIATGSHAKMPPIEGINDPSVVTSTELLDIDHVPTKLCIVGAGVIGMEFAAAFSTFGSEVTVIEFLKECLPPIDSDIAKRLRKQLEKKGVKFYLQAGVKRIENGNVTFERKGKEETILADTVLIATGRAANIEGLGLEAAGIEVDRKGIVVDEHFCTNVKNIYAIGDVNGKQMLAHAAEFQGYHVLNQILGHSDHINFQIMPSAVFTNPEIAGVGLTEDQCKEQGLNYKCFKSLYRANGKAVSMNAVDGLVKLITKEVDGKSYVIGCHVLGAHAADLVQEMTTVMNDPQLSISDFNNVIHIHPTLSEILHEAGLIATSNSASF